ncbi:hypothetical protein YDYSG_56160 [Paenibacillus tyrfis]|uniref:DEAD/DEAH box helicase n=1 Tax=Paenibacillus tyrfis TaxID=1501230 RepID=UPI0028436BCF|nr:hypothetical protein YDYSG_56160 [Paenibacillus tyrfis]
MDAESPIGFHPLLAAWFGQTFGEPTEVQLRAWESIGSGAHTLIAAPTGSGKTLAALLPCLDRIVTGKAADGEVRGVKLLYITPLKALNNDIHHHVVGFIDQLERTAAETGLLWPGLTVGVRTGDTTQSTRASMLRQPPDVLVTTPESLYILLTSLKGRDMLRTVRHVIVDEIHDLAEGARGLHLSVSWSVSSFGAGIPHSVSACRRRKSRSSGWHVFSEAGSLRKQRAGTVRRWRKVAGRMKLKPEGAPDRTRP